MYFIIQQILSLVKLLHSDNSDEKIAWAFVLGFFSAVMPFYSLQGVVFLALAILFRFQLGAFLLSWLLFSILVVPFLGLFHYVGEWILSLNSLQSTFVYLQKSDLWSLTQFNNTIVMGGFWTTVLFSPFLYLLFKSLLKKYRAVFFGYIQNTKVYYFLKSTVFVKVYDLYGRYGNV